MNSILWTTLFAVLMAGAILVMLTILVGLATDSATWAVRDRRAWLARFQPFCLAMQRNETSTNFIQAASTKTATWRRCWPLGQPSCTCSEKTAGRQVMTRGHF